jgi:hypothetical protein
MKRFSVVAILVLWSAFSFSQKMSEIKTSSLPKSVTEYVQKNLPGSQITKAAKVEDKGVVTYNVAVDVKGKKHILIFDKDGKFLKKGDNVVGNKSQARPQPNRQSQ